MYFIVKLIKIMVILVYLDWNQEDGGGGVGGGEKRKSKITNMIHHRIHVHNI